MNQSHLVIIIIIIIYPRYQCSRGRFEKKLVKMKRLGMSKIPCGRHVEEQR